MKEGWGHREIQILGVCRRVGGAGKGIRKGLH